MSRAATRSIAARMCPASGPPPIASNASVACVAPIAATRSSANDAAELSTTCAAPSARSSSTCAGRRTMLTSGT